MPTDITKVNFDPRLHYAGVMMQQGRVLTDDDWNENERIEHEERRRTQVDVIGPFGSPDDGFKIPTPITQAAGLIDFNIGAGTIYLGGLRLDMEEPESFQQQKDWWQMLPTDYPVPTAARFDLVYLEAWQQSVTAVEDEGLLEVALGGPDTTTRIRNMRRVKIKTNILVDNCEDAWTALQAELGAINAEHELQTQAKLKVSFSTTGLSDDLCSPSVAGGYLGAQNQTIRVQLTTDGTTFTWGFDNASALYRAELLPGNRFRLLTEPKDGYHRPREQQVVEVIPHAAVLANGQKIAALSGTLTKVSTIVGGEYLLSTPVPYHTAPNPEPVFVRIWDRGEDVTSPIHIPIVATPVDLGSTGLQVLISDGPKRPDDFWVISARPQTPNEVIPWAVTLGTGIAPNGVRRYYGSLAIIRWSLVGGAMVGTVIHDCRKPFLPLTENRDHCELIVPGQDIQTVINKYEAGRDICLCFQNGEYILSSTVKISGKGHIKFTGCGKGSLIIINTAEPAFLFEGCKDITIRDLSVRSNFSGHLPDIIDGPGPRKYLNGVISATSCQNILIENILATCRNRSEEWSKREATCITIKETTAATISIRHSEFNIGNQQTGILIVNADKVHLENNRLFSLGLDMANQGIVVAGVTVKEVHIKDNNILNVQQGIHIGTSKEKPSQEEIEATTTAQEYWALITKRSTSIIISGNNVECGLKSGTIRERHGIFVGNCDSLILRDNHIKLDKEDGLNLPMNGIRIYGHFGKRVIVRDNFLEGFDYVVEKRQRNIGILIRYFSSVDGRKWWIVEANVTESLSIKGAGKPFRTAKMICADRWRPH